MNKIEWVINVLKESSPKKEFPIEFEEWLLKNVSERYFRISVEECILSDMDKFNKENVSFYQNGKEFTDITKMDKTKDALVILKEIESAINVFYYIYWYQPKELKTMTIYGVKTTDDKEGNSSIKAYCATLGIAFRESEKYSDYGSTEPASAENIVRINLIID